MNLGPLGEVRMLTLRWEKDKLVVGCRQCDIEEEVPSKADGLQDEDLRQRYMRLREALAFGKLAEVCDHVGDTDTAYTRAWQPEAA
jgi:hypothetical protein